MPKTVSQVLYLLLLWCCTYTVVSKDTWPSSTITVKPGHYPGAFCRVTNMQFNGKEKIFYFKNTKEGKLGSCYNVEDIWDIKAQEDMSSTKCTENVDVGYVFTIYYWYGVSNYFHLHWDMMFPLYSVLYPADTDSTPGKIMLMPSVETSRLQKLNWDTPAFNEPKKYWMQLLQILTGPHALKPLHKGSFTDEDTICFKEVYFGTPSYSHKDTTLIQSYTDFVKSTLAIQPIADTGKRVGLISRSGRRRILNEKDLVSAVQNFAPLDLIEFSGMSITEQIQTVQNYSVLIGVNGAGLMNAVYLPSSSVAVQLVPYNASVNYIEFGAVLKARGPYLEWHNKHKDLTVEFPGDIYRNNPDTIVHVEEFKALVKEALTVWENEMLKMKTEL